MPDAHALLSASSSYRWLHCTPSAQLEAKLPDKTSEYAAEGTKAHAMSEKRLRHYLQTGELYKRPDDVDSEMWEATGLYMDTVLEKINEAREASSDAETLIEEKLIFSEWVPEGFGTGDVVIISDQYIEVIDLKYGKGVPVSAVNNTQMKLYALGALASYDKLYAADKVRMTIVQPRLDSISTDEMSVEDLLSWGEKIKPIAARAYKGEGEKRAGEWCRFCRAGATCRTLADKMLKNVKTDLDVADLSPEEIAGIVLKAKDIKQWLDNIKEYALVQVLDGKSMPGLKVVEGRSIRHITDDEMAATNLKAAGYSDDVIWKPRQLQALTYLEKAVGKGKLKQLIGPLIEKPKGKPTLVAESDKRPPMELDAAIADDLDDKLLQDISL